MRLGPDLFNLCEPPRLSIFIEPPLGGPTDDERLVVVRIHAVGYAARVARTYVGRYASEAEILSHLSGMFGRMQADEHWPSQGEFVADVKEALAAVPPF